MKLIIDEDTTVFLINSYIKDTDYTKEKNLKKLIKKLNKKYKTNLYGFIDATIYIDKTYGVIINMKKTKNYFDYFNKDIDISINVIEKNFWYKVENPTIKNIKKICKKDGFLYIKPKDTSSIELAKLIEQSEIIYNESWRWYYEKKRSSTSWKTKRWEINTI